MKWLHWLSKKLRKSVAVNPKNISQFATYGLLREKTRAVSALVKWKLKWAFYFHEERNKDGAYNYSPRADVQSARGRFYIGH